MLKKVRVDYIMEIDDIKLDKACKIAMIGRNHMIKKLRQRAEVYGKASAYEQIELIINNGRPINERE